MRRQALLRAKDFHETVTAQFFLQLLIIIGGQLCEPGFHLECGLFGAPCPWVNSIDDNFNLALIGWALPANDLLKPNWPLINLLYQTWYSFFHPFLFASLSPHHSPFHTAKILVICCLSWSIWKVNIGCLQDYEVSSIGWRTADGQARGTQVWTYVQSMIRLRGNISRKKWDFIYYVRAKTRDQLQISWDCRP